MAGNPFDEFDQATTTANPFDEFDSAKPAPAAPSASRSVLDWASDTGSALLKGAVALPQAVVGLADIPTGGRVGKALEGVGYRPGAAKEMIDAWYSPQQKAANAAVQQADGFVDTTVAALQNPSAIGGAAVESLPQMLGGAGVARGAMKLAPKLAPWLAGAAGEGTLAAGSAASEAREKNADGLLSGRQALAAVGSGVGTAAFGAAGGKLAQRLGLGDVDTMLAAGTSKLSKAPPGFIKQVIGSGISEGVFEELPQSIQEKMWENWGAGKPLDEGVGNAAAMGMLTGAAMGVAGGGYTAARGGRGEAAPPVPRGADAGAIDADEVLGAPADPAPPAAATGATNGRQEGQTEEVLTGTGAAAAAPTDAEKALANVRQLTSLDRVQEIDRILPTAPEADREALQVEREALSKDWPKIQPGLETTFTTEAGARLSARYALVEADDLQSSHDEALRVNPRFPPELQPRQRERAASRQQIAGIVGKLDPARLGASPDAANGAPIIGADGLVESGNARSIALKRVYQANGQKALDYKSFIQTNAAQFGVDPAAVDAMRKPVLVRVRTTPVDRAEFARQANADTVARMSPSEQARSDSARVDSMEDLNPDEQGDFATSRDFIRRFMARLPATEQSGMIDAEGRLSSQGYARVRNAVLAKAYGDSPVLTRMVESMDDNLRNISKALMIAAPRVAKARGAIADGRLHDADITPHLVGAAEWLSRIKDSGSSVDDTLAQAGLLGDDATPEARDMLRFLADNVRRPRKIADFIGAYFDALEAAGDPAQGDLLGETTAPTTNDLMGAARRTQEPTNAASTAADPQRGNDREVAPAGPGAAGQPPDAPGGGRGDQGDGAAGATSNVAGEPQDQDWVKFGADFGSLGIPRSHLPQFPADANGALVNYLNARGIKHRIEEVDAGSLKPTQAEYSPDKVQRAGESDSGAAIPVSSDGYVIDGHHRWLAKRQANDSIRVLRLDAPIQQVLDTATNFPSAEVDDASPVARRAAAVAEFKDAAGDLVQILTKHQRAAMVPEETPELMNTLVRMFSAAIKVVGTDLKRATAWVREQLKADPETKKLWNKISDATYRKAALRAIEGADDVEGDMLGGQARLSGETDKAFAKRVVDKRPVPTALPETYADYFTMAGARVVPIADLISTKSAEENAQGGENGAKRMAAAAAGELSKRGPITVMPAEKAGKFEVVDGNGTLTSVSRYGWKSLPVAVVSREEGLRMMAEDKAKDAAKAASVAAMIDGRAYDMKRDNFQAPRTDEFLQAELLDLARGYVAKFAKEAPPLVVDPADRAEAEGVIKPLLERAGSVKVAYDQKIIDIAKRAGALGQMIAPLKGIKRAAEKLITEPRLPDGSLDGASLKDLLRSTIVVGSYDDAQAVVDEIRREFKVLPGRIKNRTDRQITGPEVRNQGFLPSGYGDILINVAMPNGSTAEIQINVPEMLSAKENEGHKLYEVERDQPDGSDLKAAVVAAQSDFYAAAARAAAERAARKKNSSDEEVPARGMAPAGRSAPVASSSLNTRPSGNLTQSSPEKSAAKAQPGGNLSGAFKGASPAPIVANKGQPGYAQDDLFGDGNDATNDRAGAEGPGATAARGTEGGGQADGARRRAGGADQRPGRDGGDGAARGQEVGPAAADGTGGQDEGGGSARSRKRARRDAAVPAGRDIQPKSGRNYRLTDADLTYAGSWQKKAERNVDAVELLKKLQADGRQATVDEQRVLAQFNGWGAGDIANNLFGAKPAKMRREIEGYDRLVGQLEALKRDHLRKGGMYRGDYADSGYYDALQLLKDAGKPVGYPDRIDRAMLDQIKPDGVARRWLELHDRLKKVLTPGEWAEASRSTQYAHFTSKGIVRAMWAAAERFGYKGGAALEPGAGSGVFPGLMPDALAANTSYTGIEYDSITGGILAQLQPDERILVDGYQNVKLPRDFYDLAIGNPPFSGTKVLSDPEYAKQAFALHDYFFAKTMDRVRPGGLVMFVTSRYTMDKLTDKARAYLAERADLVGAIRLPQTAFKQNAGTDVVTDVIFLRKKVAGEQWDGAQPWTKSVPMKVGSRDFPVNEYFHAHPEMVLGTPSDAGSMQNSPEPQYTVEAPEGDIEALFAAAVEKMPTDILKPARGSAAEAAKVRELDFNPKAQKEGNYYVSDAGVLMQREEGVGRPVQGKSPKDTEILKAFVPLRDALKQAHYDQLNGGDWATSLKTLQDAYKAFADAHGAVNQSVARQVKVKVDELDDDGNPTGRKVDDVEERRTYPLLRVLQDDPDWTLVSALEKVNEETGATSPGAFLTQRVLGGAAARPAIATPHDALLTVLNDTGTVDIDLIAERIDMDPVDVIEALGSAVYRNPEGSAWETADQYLSGNVKRKLEAATVAAKTDRSFDRNVEALKAAQPAPKSPADINVAIGMNWIPGIDYARFLHHVAGIKSRVVFNEATRQWSVQFPEGVSQYDKRATADWGTDRRHAGDILEHALTGRPIRIESKVGTGKDAKTVFDATATEAANAKLEAMREEFSRWVWTDADRSTRLVQAYNDKFNTTVPRSFDGRHLTLPGATSTIDVFDHVKRGAWRIVQSGNTYLAHAVGSGKTFQMVISAMEQKRLGLVKKPMMIVPNHMLQQFAREWQELYPAARLMVADEQGFHTDNRRRWAARVALSDLDGVIMTHSAFKLLDLDPEFKAKIIEEQVEYLRASLEEAEAEDGDGKKKSPRVKQIEKRIENLEEKLKASLSGVGKDKNVRFDELGVDMLYVDEAHGYRKLDYATARQIKGISPQGSEAALDLYIKARWLDDKKPGRSLVMASGTPVTNTMAELYSVQRFMGRKALEERGIEDFDSWAAMFGRERTSLEANASGKYEPVTRFNKFVNVGELTQMFRDFADVVTGDQLAVLLGDKRPKVDGGSRKIIITPKTKDYATFQRLLEVRYEESRAWKPSKDEPNNPDPVIAIIGDGRLAAIDMRFINPRAPSDPQSKLNRMIDDVIREFKATADMEFHDKKTGLVEPAKGSTMMVFSDLGFGQGVAANRGFSARAWMEKRLRDAGVPMGQVAFMSDFKKSTDKLKLFRDLNAGRVRILVGSSKNMGTGVNAQQRLLNLFHLDSPWFPADLEQREGRIIRQGNKNKQVRIHGYAAKGSYDETMWGMLARKQFFIEQALSGDGSVREIEDVDSVGQYEMAAALVAEDPRILQLAGLRAEAEKLQRLYSAHENQRFRFREEFRSAQLLVDYLRQALPEAQAMAAKVADLSGDRFTAKAGRATYTDRTEWGQALKAEAGKLAANVAPSQDIGSVSGFPVRFVSSKTESAYEWRVELATPMPVALVMRGDESEIGMAVKAANAIADLARAPDRIRERMVQASASMDAVRGRLETPFPMADMLAGKLREAAALEAEIAADSKDRTWRVERKDTGLGFDVQASSATRAIQKAIESNGGTEEDWRAIEGAGVAGLDGQIDTAWGVMRAEEPDPAGDVVFSRGSRGGMPYRELLQVAARVARKLPGLPNVEVLRSPSDAPQALQAFIQARGAMADVEGALHDGTIYLFASGLADAQRAEHVLAEHEAAHAGLRATLGERLRYAMQLIHNENQSVRQLAAPLIKGGMSITEAVEEVIVDIPSAQLARLKGWRKVVGKVRDALAARGFDKLAAQLDRWLAGHLTEQQRADLFVADLVREARAFVARKSGAGRPAGTVLASSQKLSDDLAAQERWLQAKAKAAGHADIEALLAADYPLFERLAAQWREEHPAEAMLSRAPAATAPGAPAQPRPPAADRANTIIQTAASTPAPIDAVFAGLTRVSGINRATTMLYGLGARLIDRVTPEIVKAGVVSDYGVPEAVIDRRALMVGGQRMRLASAGKLLEKLATLTRAESRVAYEWMNMGDDADPHAFMSLMQGLPEESVAVLQEVQKMIDSLSQEAVRLGQLEPEAYKRHRMAYLRRSYVKHTQELNPQETAARAGAIRILGDQYKGRGMVKGVPMKQVQNVAPDWWKRKMVPGKADTSLKGEKFERLERRAPAGAGTNTLPFVAGQTAAGRILEVHYWPVGELKPAKYRDWDSAGTWEVRDTKAGDLVMWRDFTKEEREKMGEIDEARFAIGKTLHGMIHDIEVGSYLEWLAQSQSKADGDTLDGPIVEAGERALDTFKPGTWVQVPDAKIPGTSVARYGKLAGRYIPGPVWSDLRQIMGGGRIGPEWYRQLLRAWKTSKTALSPGVHTNNVMSNLVMADWHDVTAGHVAKSLRIILAASDGKKAGALGAVARGGKVLGIEDAEAAREIMARYEASGGAIGSWVTSEIAKDQLAPIIELLQAEVGAAAQAAGAGDIGVYSALQHLLHARFPAAWESFKGSRPAKAVATDAGNLIDLYQAEDDVFRLAAWLKAKEGGASDAEAGKRARKSFLDYSINAPWVSALRQTALPFVAFTYRAVPMLLETAAKRPHKLIKLMAMAGALNYLGVLIGGGGDDDERNLLPEEKAGRIWGMVPKLIRMPWNDSNGSPVYLDIRRWIPVGDVIDTGQGHAALGLPPVVMPGGPLALLGELYANKSMFTGKAITLETDTALEKTGKVFDHLYKAFAPNILGLPGTYATQGVMDAARGKTDAFGRELSVPTATASAFGLKLGAYPADVLRRQVIAKRDAEISEVDRGTAALKRQLRVNGISQEDFDKQLQRQIEKERDIRQRAAAQLE